MQKLIIVAILILSLFGVVDSGYLLVQTISGKAVICPNVSVGRFNLNQCNVVLATPYAKFLGLPTAFYGLAAYLLFAILTLYGAVKILAFLSGAGILISAYFVYLQFFIIEAICFYCLISAAIMTLIFALSVIYTFEYSEGD